MQEAKKGVSAERSRDRQVRSEATSKDTLQDVEKSEKASKSSGDEESVPSPDGQPADRHKHERADGSDSGGPM